MRVVAYCRVSTDNENQKTSIENQQEYYSELFEKLEEKGHAIFEQGMLYKADGTKQVLKGIYADEGLSASKTYKHREAFKQMIKDAKRKLFDRVYIKNVTRFSRSVEDGSKVLKDLKEYGVEAVFEDGNLSSLNPTHELVINMLMATAQEESRLKSSAIQFGIRQAQKEGKWTGGNLPYGYDMTKGFLNINKEESETVKLIFNLYYNESYGTQKIARYLNGKGILTKKSKKWSQIQVRRILENDIYIGKQITHKEIVNDVNRGTKRKVNEEDWIIHYKEELRIIDDESFNLVQMEIKKRLDMMKNKQRPSTKHLFSNLLICDNCRNALKRKKRKAYRRKDGTSKELGYEWACTINDRYGKDRCEYRNALTEEYIIDRIKNEILNIKNDKSKLETIYKEYCKVNFEVTQEQINDIKIDIDKIKKNRELNFGLLSEGIIDKEEYKDRNDILQEQLKEKQDKMNRYMYIDKEIKDSRLKYNKYLEYINSVNVDKLTNATLKKIINYIEVYTIYNEETGKNEKDINIYWNFLDSSEDQILLEGVLKELKG